MIAKRRRAAAATRTWASSSRPRPRRCSPSKGYDPVLGARPLRRTIQREIEDALSEKILFGELQPGPDRRRRRRGRGRARATFTFRGEAKADRARRPAGRDRRCRAATAAAGNAEARLIAEHSTDSGPPLPEGAGLWPLAVPQRA